MAWQSGQCGRAPLTNTPIHFILHRWHPMAHRASRIHFQLFTSKTPILDTCSGRAIILVGRDCPAPIYCFRLRRQRSSQLTLMIYALNQTYIILAAGTKKPCIVYKCVFQSLILIFPPNLGEEGWEQAAWSCHIRSQEITGDQDHDINIDISWEVRGGDSHWPEPDWAWLELSLISPLMVRGLSVPLSPRHSRRNKTCNHHQPPGQAPGGEER